MNGFFTQSDAVRNLRSLTFVRDDNLMSRHCHAESFPRKRKKGGRRLNLNSGIRV